MNTQHILKHRFNKTRKPRLQFDILGCLLLNGKLTRGEIEKKLKKNRTDINKSVKLLLSKKLIKVSDYIRQTTRPVEFLRITITGMQYLIELHEYNENKFWKALIGYIIHEHEKKLSEFDIRDIIKWFLKHYLEYNYNGSNQLEVLNDSINDIILNHVNRENIIDLQKIVEALAVGGELTLSELANTTRCSLKTIRKILFMHSLEGFTLDEQELDSNKIQSIPPIFISKNPEETIGRKSDDYRGIKNFKSLITHSLITITKHKHQPKENSYKLTLYGIIFVLTTIRLLDRGLLQYSLLYRNLSFQEYFDVIAKNYKELLPLIFGKWNLLKRELRLLALYNFDIIVDKGIRQVNTKSISVLNGGNSELIQGISQLFIQNSGRLYFFLIVGQRMIFQITDLLPDKFTKEISDIDDYLTLSDININISNYKNLDILKEVINKMFFEAAPLEYLSFKNPFTRKSIDKLTIDKYLAEFMEREEKNLEEEITSLYYLNFHHNRETNKRFSYPMNFYSKNRDSETIHPPFPPKRQLERLAELDKYEPLISKFVEDLSSDLWLLAKNVEQTVVKLLRYHSESV